LGTEGPLRGIFSVLCRKGIITALRKRQGQPASTAPRKLAEALNRSEG
jgi:hypothetical protein